METYIVHKPGMTLAGISVRTTNEQEAGADGVLPGLWENYFASDLAVKTATLHPEHIYALYTEYESDATGAYTVILGHSVITGEGVTNNSLYYASLPASNYMVFTTDKGPVYEIVLQAWIKIWAYFQNSPLEVRTYRGDFELYDSRNSDPENAVVQIYIAIS